MVTRKIPTDRRPSRIRSPQTKRRRIDAPPAMYRRIHVPYMQQTYDALENMNVGAATKGLNAFLDALDTKMRKKNASLSAATRALVQGALDIRTVREFKDGVAKCEQWLRKKVNGRPYAIAVEYDDEYGHAFPKSSLWLAHRVVHALGPPVGIVTLRDTQIGGLHEARRAGAQCLVHLNDAVYSGTQLSEDLKDIQEELLYDKTRRPPKFSSRSNLLKRVQFPIYAAAAYGTKSAEKKITGSKMTYSFYKNEYNVTYPLLVPPSALYFARYLPPSPLLRGVLFAQLQNNMMKSRGEIVSMGLKLNPTFSTMPYKIPDRVSFGAIFPSSNNNAAAYKNMNASEFIVKAVARARGDRTKTPGFSKNKKNENSMLRTRIEPYKRGVSAKIAFDSLQMMLRPAAVTSRKNNG